LTKLNGKITIQKAFVISRIGFEFARDGRSCNADNFDIATSSHRRIGLVGQGIIES
jgi:hypothetical protein